MAELEKKWLVFYTKSRWEKKVAQYLEKFGFEPFLPVHKVVRQWSDRKKKIEVPLFNSYIFVRDHESRISDILQIPGISWNIKHNGKPAVLRDNEMELIKNFISTGLFLETTGTTDLEIGDKVEVIDGPLRGAVGVLSGEYNDQKFTIIMDSIDQAIKIDIDKTVLKRID
jgi:transcription antitermination factor NusG